MPEYGQQITTGIKYIKVSKTDKEGNDNSQNLQTANKLRINYPDVGVQEYLIQTSQNFADYYLFGVIPNANTSSINEILDYSVEARRSPASITVNTTPTNISSSIPVWGVINGNTLGYFISTGESNASYILGNTPNVPLYFNFSGSYNNSSGGDIDLNIGILNSDSSTFSDDYLVFLSETLPNGSGNFDIPFTMSGDYMKSEGEGISFDWYTNTSTLSITGFILLVTSSNPLNATEVLTTIEPTYDFQFSDYNILNGNIDIARTSRQFLDVDYSTGVLTPTNITTIISGTATPAAVQDSNYTLQRHTNPRYGGSRDSSPDFNTVVRTSSTDNPTQPIRTIYQAPENDGSVGK